MEKSHQQSSSGSALIVEDHAAWIKMPGKDGQKHQDTELQSPMFDYSHQGIAQRGSGWLDPYQDAWSSIAAASEKI